MMKNIPIWLRYLFIYPIFFFGIPTLASFVVTHMWHFDLSIPFSYGLPGADEIWQYGMVKTLLDTGWIFHAPLIGAPGEAHWLSYNASQMAIFHQLAILFLSIFSDDPIYLFNLYFLLGFSLITITGYWGGRVLNIQPFIAFSLSLTLAFLAYRFNMIWSKTLGLYLFTTPMVVITTLIICKKLTVPSVGKTSYNTFLPDLFDFVRLNWLKAAILLSVVILCCMGDGYYTFYFVLLLVVVTFGRILSTEFAKWGHETIVPFLIVALAIATFAISVIPLSLEREKFPDLFLQDGSKQSYEAEIYSEPMKLLFAPNASHRVDFMRNLGQKMIQDSNRVSKFEKPSGASAAFGALGSFVVFMVFIFFFAAAVSRPSAIIRIQTGDNQKNESYLKSLMGLSFIVIFTILISIQGGIGSMIALLVPEIRAYQRFPIFASAAAVLFLGIVLTMLYDWLRNRMFKLMLLVSTALISIAAIYDQLPPDPLGIGTEAGRESKSARYLEERNFVQSLDNTLPADSMIYIFPYSQYLSLNPYYGHGSFGHYRPFLFSDSLRWSSGAHLYTPEDKYHTWLSAQPLQNIINELRAVGFRGVLLDRAVLNENFAEKVSTELTALTKAKPVEASKSGYIYFSLGNPKSEIKFNKDFSFVDVLLLKKGFNNTKEIETFINTDQLASEIKKFPLDRDLTLLRTDKSQLFKPLGHRYSQLGNTAVDYNEFRGDLFCKIIDQNDSILSIEIELVNTGNNDLVLNSGYPMPMTIAKNQYGENSEVSSDQIRTKFYVGAGGQSLLQEEIQLKPFASSVRIELLQEGVNWYSIVPQNKFCTLHKVGNLFEVM